MLKIKLIILTLCVGLFSCVSINTPKTEKKAKKKLNKHTIGISNILNEYPQLSDSINIVVYDTIVLDSHVVDTSFIPDIDTLFIDSILFDAINIDSDIILMNEERQIERQREVIERVRYIRNQIINEVLKDTSAIYEDDDLKAIYGIRKGSLFINPVIKSKKVPYKKQQTNVNLNTEIDKPAWKYYWFWLLLLIIFLLLTIIRLK